MGVVLRRVQQAERPELGEAKPFVVWGLGWFQSIPRWVMTGRQDNHQTTEVTGGIRVQVAVVDTAILKKAFHPLPEAIRWGGLADGQPRVIISEISLFFLAFPALVP
jgi:hypothetical protein